MYYSKNIELQKTFRTTTSFILKHFDDPTVFTFQEALINNQKALIPGLVLVLCYKSEDAACINGIELSLCQSL